MGALNPQITIVSVGVKQLREITIYPLSMADQFKMTDLIVSAVNEFYGIAKKNPDNKGLGDQELITTVLGLIEKNLQRILGLITDDAANIQFDELTNDQFSDLITLIYEINYEASLKKLSSLSTRIRKLLPTAKITPKK